MMEESQFRIDSANRTFWDALCGTSLARTLGIKDYSASSLASFDAYYLSFYPYLMKHVPVHRIWGKRVLEVGLGYGTLAQVLAASCDYMGLDIARGPVELVNSRLQMLGLPGGAREGSILAPPFEEGSFDVIVSIGCLHHTGNMPAAVAQIHRLLKPGGEFLFMVYNAYSYRRWLRFTGATFRDLAGEYLGLGRAPASEALRSAYDAGDAGGAPETEFYSSRQLRRMLKGFERITVTRENADSESLFRRIPRDRLLETIAPWFGLDLYVRAVRL